MDASAKALINNVMSHDLAQLQQLRRAKLAQEAGLPVEPFALPFPGNVTIMHQAPNPPSNTFSKLAGAALVAAGLLTGGGVTAAALATIINKPATPAPAPSGFDIEIPWRFQDGEMKFGEPKQTACGFAK